jgi:TPR repeat protein
MNIRAAILLLFAMYGVVPCISIADGITGGRSTYNKGDHKTALQLLLPEARKGNHEAQYLVAKIYDDGNGITRNEKEIHRWLTSSAEGGYADAQFFLGTLHVAGIGLPKNEKVGAEWIEKSAKQNHAEAVEALGMLYMKGLGVPKNEATAARWLNIAT